MAATHPTQESGHRAAPTRVVMRLLGRFKGLSSKIHLAFLISVVVPVTVVGLVGMFYALHTLKNETLQHLDQEVASRAAGMAHFLDQLTSELLYLASSSLLGDLATQMAASGQSLSREVRQRLERDYTAFARAYPYIYQVRFLSARGVEVVRVDRRDGRLYVVPEDELQDKVDRYYVHEGMGLEPGQVYVSPLDLNVEHGRIEIPERPVIRFATPIADRKGVKRGLLIINLRAEFVLNQVQEMASGRGGVAYLFDRSGFYVSRSGVTQEDAPALRMQSAEALTGFMPRPLLTNILGGKRGTEVLGEWIVAHAPISIGETLADRSDSSMGWSIALAFPRNRLFEAVFNLYLLYSVLALSLVVTAVAGFVLSRHLLRPLTVLSQETEEIAKGHFSRRAEIRGQDEIADLGRRFNTMAAGLEQSYKALEEQRDRLESLVQARTAALERERQSLATIIEHNVDGILSLGPDGTIERANRAAEQLLGGPLAGQPLGRVWPDSREHLAEAMASAQARRVDLLRDRRLLALSIAPVAPDGRCEGHIVVVRDVTEERRLQDERRELDRQMFQMEKMGTLGELAMGLAHEIGNPLTGMKTVLQLLLEEQGLSDRVRRYLQRVQDEVDRLSAFLRTFHGFSAPQETHPASCRLEEALEDVLLWTRKEARSRGVQISYAPCYGPVPGLWADPRQLKQVLLNLVINAIHAMPDGGDIEVGMCARSADTQGPVPRMRFCVQDTGIGIPAEVLPRIFDPFFTTRADGSGLGLAVVKKIAMQHGADIHVESAPGQGTRFELVWPIEPGAAGNGTWPALSDTTCVKGCRYG
ncbi:MAG TPA: ATP-binding protein [Methylomirabilota bacterium]|nr:ATP-binding protein [Methylomirabilota bacterium]